MKWSEINISQCILAFIDQSEISFMKSIYFVIDCAAMTHRNQKTAAEL